MRLKSGLPVGARTQIGRLGVLFYRKSGVKNAIFLDFRAFYARKCVYFKAFCSFRQVIFASNTKNYTNFDTRSALYSYGGELPNVKCEFRLCSLTPLYQSS